MKADSPSSHRVHYGWIIVAVGTLTIVACLGLARFAFGMLLPSMGTALQLSYDQMGLLGTANFAGYLTAVGLTPFLLRQLTPRILIAAGLLLIALCMTGISLSQGFLAVLSLYTLVGIGSGLANIPLMVLVSYWFRRERRGRAAGFIVIGSGFAIMLSGFLIPRLNALYGDTGWRISWAVLAALVLAIALIAALFIRNHPQEKGLEPVGKAGGSCYDPSETHGPYRAGQILARLGALYFAFGATYVIYGTFIVTTLIEEYGFAEQTAGHFWSWVGFFSLFSGVVFGTLSDHIGRKGGLMAVFSVQTLAYLLAGAKLGTAAMSASVVLYGVAAFAIPAIMAAAIGDYLGQARAAAGFSFITFCFAIGQTLGPALAGVVAEHSGSFSSSYLGSAALTATAVAVALALPAPPDGSHTP
ncbi:MAG: YbfB/YjiJ family MFS transporter [Desulfuromonadaceae bacterium]|nr:YbfB/YjiJ family MFS transporter [Desulfuromonadaceae bacterium]